MFSATDVKSSNSSLVTLRTLFELIQAPCILTSKKETTCTISVNANKKFSNGNVTFSALIVILLDWAMKFTQRRIRKKQSEWYAKRGMSWHVSSVITRHLETSQLEMSTYAHLMDSCTQDWFSVLSLLENLLQVLHQSIMSRYPRCICVQMKLGVIITTFCQLLLNI